MILVTGTAPRCGTSAMMRELIKHYKPHSYAQRFPDYVAVHKNPEGFWDIQMDKLFIEDPIPTEEKTVLKLWSPQFSRINSDSVKLMVIMFRKDLEAQVKSISECALAEGSECPTEQHIKQMFINQQTGINRYFKNVPKLGVEMETFREHSKAIISSIKELV